jgi:hypothetical protein
LEGTRQFGEKNLTLWHDCWNKAPRFSGRHIPLIALLVARYFGKAKFSSGHRYCRSFAVFVPISKTAMNKNYEIGVVPN